MSNFNLPEIALKIIPIILVIAKMIVEARGGDGISAEEAAAIALFNALLAYMEASA
jgi:hypothetical protein